MKYNLPMEKTSGQRRHGQNGGGGSSRILAHDGYLIRVTAKFVNVLFDPFKNSNLIHDSIISRGSLVVGSQEAKNSQTIVEGDQNDIVFKEVIGT